MIYTILLIVQVVVALSLVGLILVQHGKGADAGAAFGSGASGTVFGAKGSANFMTRATAALATLFFALSLSLAYLVNDASTPSGSITDQVQQPPGASLLSDKDNDGVAGDEVARGEQSESDGSAAPEQAPANAGKASGSGNGQAGGNAGDADTSAQVPE